MSSAHNTYRAYKRDTEAMFTWLSQSLDKIGVGLDRRLEDSSIRSLLKFASDVQKKNINMPYEVLFALENALKTRRQYHAWYSDQLSQGSSGEDTKDIRQANESHKAFINVLQQIHDLFNESRITTSQVQQAGPVDQKAVQVTNLFANLETEDTAKIEDDDSMANAVNQSAGPPPAMNPLMEKKARALVEDKILELYCLFEDANKIREYLRKKWAEYHSRKVDIISAAITTQEALELFSEIEHSYELKHCMSEANHPGRYLPKFVDLFNHLSTRWSEDRTHTEESFAPKMRLNTKVAKLQQQQQQGEEHELGAEASGWAPSDELEDWVFKPASCALLKMQFQSDDWFVKQACRTAAERSRDLDSVLDDKIIEPSLRTAARERLDTFVDIYAGMVFLRKNPEAFVTPHDIATSMWTRQYDCSIRMILTMQVLHDISTAKSSESGQVDILTQVSEDYKRLGGDAAVFSRYLCGELEQLPESLKFLKATVEKERSWLKGRVPGCFGLPNRIRKKGLPRISELPLQTNPILAGMILFYLSYNSYVNRISSVNDRWFLVPLAHVLNWLTMAQGEAAEDLQKIWPDLHAALGMIGPRPVWKGSGPPMDSRTCRNRMLLLWGLPLKEFYQRMTSGDIPRAEELFNRIKSHETTGAVLSDEERGMMLRGSSRRSAHTSEPDQRMNQLLRVDASQSMPLLDAVRENLYSEGLMKAQQSHIRKVVLASVTDAEGQANMTSSSPSKQKRRQEPDMLSYIDSFSRLAQAEVPRLMFPLDEVSLECCGVACLLFGGAVVDNVTVPSGMWECAAMSPFRATTHSQRMARIREGEFGGGAQSMCSLLALITMFGDRPDSQSRARIEHLMLELLEKEKKNMSEYFNDRVTKEFVEKCNEFGFTVPQCATEALSLGRPVAQST